MNRPASSGEGAAKASRSGADRGRHVVLFGLMGSGKSTVGLHVANALQLPFVDSDSVVEVHHGHGPVELERLEGTARLHDAELETMRRVLGTRDPVVFAAAASVVDRLDPAELDEVFAVWLDAPPEVLAERLVHDYPRPVLGDDPLGTLRRQAATRRPMARQLVDLWIDEHDADPREVSDQIARGCRNAQR